MERTSRREVADEGEASATVTRSIGAVVAGTYRLTRHIGSGGSSHVFEAEHVRLGKPFAVKLLRPELDPTRQTARRFRREARAIARLNSEHIVSVVDCGELDDHTPYIVMELLQGEDLRSLLKREGRLPARRVVSIVVEACRALTEAHSAGLVHRDLKPENLFITRRATGEDWCKVLDFGVAKMDASLSTTQGAIVGTVRYMSPEQLADGAKVDAATDIHALGAILYECLSGRAAHSGESIQEAMFSVLNKHPRPLDDVPPALGALVLRCLAKDPAQRPASARVLAAELGRSLSLKATVPAERTVTEEAPPREGSTSSPVGGVRRAVSLPVAVGFGTLAVALAAWRVAPQKSDQQVARAAPTAAVANERASVSQPAVTQLPATTASTEPPPAIATASAAPGTSRPRLAAAASLPRLSPTSNVAQQVAPAPPRAPAVGNLDPANPYSE